MEEETILSAELRSKIQYYLIDNNLLKYHNCWKLVIKQLFMQDFLKSSDNSEYYIDIVKKFIQQGRNIYLHKKVSDSFGKLTNDNIFDLLHKRPNHDSIITKVCADGTTLSAEDDAQIRDNLHEMIGNGDQIIELMTNMLTGANPEEFAPFMSKETINSLDTAKKACTYLGKLTSGVSIAKEDIDNIDINVDNTMQMQETIANSNNGFTRLLESVQVAVGVCASCGGCITALCSNCKIVGYCSKKCQKKHWKAGHKIKCAKLYK